MSRARVRGPFAKLPGPLHQDLAIYALAAGAGLGVFASSHPAEAQIVYTPANESIYDAHQKISIDFNHDGLPDLIISELPYHSGSIFAGNSVRALPPSDGGVKDGPCDGCAEAMFRGSRIGPGEFFLPNRAVVAQTYSVYYFGSWFGNGNLYLGVRFPISGQMHYGWVRMYVTWAITVTVSGYAYETQPDTPINAGQTGSGNSAEAESTGDAARLDERNERAGSLGALALGASGVALWRMPR
jgi:hypothetical protein